ncbi:hypothetical protein JJB09_15595 [Rhizobium sp. KVB221]|uniref:Uncharacterized protein n=1 Tax=Rhizobium setariae TaxID=2801340 RepID=A0A936YUH4_9HYPH|nr:hypothetical protein [Rhizobium setariae]MBL0373456.1 hypothetical protein [Rhizobium setariae]
MSDGWDEYAVTPTELGILRSRLQILHDDEMLRISPDRPEMLRRRIQNGLEVALDLSGETEVEVIRMSAVGGGGPPS